jgi:hypothetical protein
MDLTKWLDEDNFIHLHPHPLRNQSENGPLFTAHVNLFIETNPYFSAIIPSKDNPNFFANGLSARPHFSHDNMTGLHSLCVTNDRPDILKKLPTFKWNNRWWLHPRDHAFYSLIKRKLICLLPLSVLVLFLTSLHSFAQPKERTSGKCMWFLRIRTLKLMYTSRISRHLLDSWERLGLKLAKATWSEIFQIYFKNKDHPIHGYLRGE